MKYRVDPERGWSVDVEKRGHTLLADPLLNKGTAFTTEERRTFEVDGMLPHRVSDRETQVARAYEHITAKGDHPLEQYIGMASLQDRNETLFYQLLSAHPDQLIPIVYTPTVGTAATRYSHIFRRGRGIWITPEHRGRMDEVLGHARNDEVRLIVATDNERILGLGDQGAGGIVIPVGKLSLYTMAAGIHPAYTLPVSLDVGTDNEALLADPLYAGWPHPRLRGEAYDEVIEEFVAAVRRRFPDALLQWEDFKKANAFRLLDRYRDTLPSFNDDIQGTAAVVVAGLIEAGRATDTPLEAQRVVLAGAGAAGMGIARQLRHAMVERGADPEGVESHIAVVDTRGLLTTDRDAVEGFKREFAWRSGTASDYGLAADASLRDVVEAVRPDVLIGTTGQPGLFGEELIRLMSKLVDHPIVMALSNPTSKCEATPADLVAWSDGRVVVATGSPFDPVEFGDRTIAVSQCNNVYVFPGVGLGSIVAGARTVTDSMFTAAAGELARAVTDDDRAVGRLFPPLTELRSVTRRIASAVAREAGRAGVAPALSDDEIEQRLDMQIWDLGYPTMNPI